MNDVTKETINLLGETVVLGLVVVGMLVEVADVVVTTVVSGVAEERNHAQS
jgi:hypothetical protein